MRISGGALAHDYPKSSLGLIRLDFYLSESLKERVVIWGTFNDTFTFLGALG